MPEPLYVIRWQWMGDEETPIISGQQGDAPMSARAAHARCEELNRIYPKFVHWVEKAPVAKPAR